MAKKRLFIVDTISSFRMRYVIEAESLEHAYDEVTMKDSGHPDDEFSEITQKHIGEQIIDGREVTRSVLEKHVLELQDTEEASILPHQLDDYIRRINYGKGN